MKRILIGLIVCLALAQAGAAETPVQAQARAQAQAKAAAQAKAQAEAQPQWLTNLPQAMAKARAEKKLVFMDFTGSDWCPPCKKLHDNVLTAAPFLDYARTNLVLVEIDFPHKKPQSVELKKANELIAQKFRVDGYPTIIVIDPVGKLLKNDSGYGNQTAQQFVEELKKLKP